MIVELDPAAAPGVPAALAARLSVHEDVSAWPVTLADRLFVVVAGDTSLIPELEAAEVVARHEIPSGLLLVDRATGLMPTTIDVGGTPVGRGAPLWLAAGPCALENEHDTLATARGVRAAGGTALRCSLFKSRSSPYHFPGKQRGGFDALARIGRDSGLATITETVDPRDVEDAAAVADCLQVDPRNIANRALLTELGRCGLPVLLMRGLHSTVDDWLRAAEYIVCRGNDRVVLCARGVVSFDDTLSFQPDLGAVLALRRRTDLPVIFDPSHCTGRREAVGRVALAAAAAGVDGLLVETHVAPERMYRPGDAAHMYPLAELGALRAACAQVRDLAAELD